MFKETLGAMKLSASIFAIIVLAEIIAIIGYIIWLSSTGKFKKYNPKKLGIGRIGTIFIIIGLMNVGRNA